MPTIREIGRLVKSGEILFDTCGHDVRGKEEFLRYYDDTVANGNGAKDGHWNKEGKMDGIDDARMREHFNRKLDWEIEFEESIDSDTDWKQVCRGCGDQLGLVYSEGRIALREYYDPTANGVTGDFKSHPLDYRCAFERHATISGTINVDSPLIFANIFREFPDTPEGQKYKRGWDLSSRKGRSNITKHKSEVHNVAWGQMTNTSIGIYVHPDNNSVIIGEPSPEEQDDYEEGEDTAIEGHEFKGDISLGVWRWEAAPLSVVKDCLKEASKYHGHVQVEAKHGIWDFEHYYDPEDDGNFPKILARLKLRS
jgi:hypothetical protein